MPHMQERDKPADWQLLKDNTILEFITLPWDINPHAANQLLESQEELRSLFKNQAGVFWRNIAFEDYVRIRFMFNDGVVQADFNPLEKILKITVSSQELFLESGRIRAIAFPHQLADYDLEYIWQSAKDKIQFPPPSYAVINPDFDESKIKDAEGTPLDNKISRLIKYLNMIGLNTTASCQGHKNQELSFPWIDFPIIIFAKACVHHEGLGKNKQICQKIFIYRFSGSFPS